MAIEFLFLYLQTQTINGMKKIIISIIAIAAFLAALAITCPDRNKHVEVLKSEFNDYKYNSMGFDFGEGTRQLMTSVLGNGIVAVGIELNLEVKNNFLFSTGHIKIREDKVRVSFGILGMVFTAEPTKVERAAELSIQNS